MLIIGFLNNYYEKHIILVLYQLELDLKLEEKIERGY